ncbi:MAG: hypothetical protein OXH90_09990 [Paracoccaceae bacterium]|nr:hypothetical protein [Paracoccaceae bacterium]MDE2917660.1 hypothetical protein [Paracoccaceae bacterium]
MNRTRYYKELSIIKSTPKNDAKVIMKLPSRKKGRGYRNRERFITDIHFHLGGLDLYPEGVKR